MPSTMKNIIQCAVNNALNRNVKWMDTTVLIYALSRSDSEAGRILSGGGIDCEDAYHYLKRFDNEPLEEGEKPQFTPTALRLVEYADSPLALLRAIQHTDCEGNQILKEHRIWPPEHEPSNGQVECAAETGCFLSARSTFSYGNLKAWERVEQASKEKWRGWTRIPRRHRQSHT